MFYLEIEFKKDNFYFGFPELYLYEIKYVSQTLAFEVDMDESYNQNLAHFLCCYQQIFWCLTPSR